MTSYDWIVVGGGPCGLTLATYLPGRVLLVEGRETLGGCHAVHRDDEGRFGEHGPRYVNECYVNLRNVLETIGLRWSDVFKPKSFGPDTVDGSAGWWRTFSAYETLVFSFLFLRLVVQPNYGRDTSLTETIERYGFSKKTASYIDAICRASDGNGADKYPLHKFLRGFNDHLGPFYQPRRANDTFLFDHWRSYLTTTRGVTVASGSPVRRLVHADGKATGVQLADGTTYAGHHVAFAVPPGPLTSILRASNLREPGLESFARQTEYDEYFCATFHFKALHAKRLVTHRGFKTTPWKLLYAEVDVVDEPTAILSVAAADLGAVSPVTGKTIDQSTRDEVVAEILRQLPLSAATKETFVGAVTTDMVRRKGRWHNKSEAYVSTSSTRSFGPFLRCCRGAYTVGGHNEQSWYPFTSFESACANALHFLGRTQTTPTFTPLTVLRLLLVFLVAYAAYVVARKSFFS